MNKTLTAALSSLLLTSTSHAQNVQWTLDVEGSRNDEVIYSRILEIEDHEFTLDINEGSLRRCVVSSAGTSDDQKSRGRRLTCELDGPRDLSKVSTAAVCFDYQNDYFLSSLSLKPEEGLHFRFILKCKTVKSSKNQQQEENHETK